ncbi:MAG TPA: SH3 domain-containing protein [Gammaproteobacteria bacterium]|nr:SH3 domain-containing protein [Gammaproteobacteria bacterium]
MIRKLTSLFFTIAAFLIASVCFAKNINLYEEPKTDAKIVGTIDPSTGIIPIFTPQEGGWVKVGNPNNGNVGWVKSEDLAKSSTTPTGFSFSQKIESTGKGPETYVFKLGIPTSLSKEQSEALYKQIQKQQAAIQQGIQKIIQNTFTNFNKPGSAGMEEIPIIMPVVVVPSPAPAKTNTNAVPPANPK